MRKYNLKKLNQLIEQTIRKEQGRQTRHKKNLRETLRRAKLILEAEEEEEETESEDPDAGIKKFMKDELKGAEGSDRGDLFTTGAWDYELKDSDWERIMAGTDDSMNVTMGGTQSVKIKECAPTQSEIGVGQSLANPISGNSYDGDGILISSAEEMTKNLPVGGYNDSSKKAVTRLGGSYDGAELVPTGGDGSVFNFNPPVVVAELASEGMSGGAKYGILDGHHRWSQAFMVNPDGKLDVVIANAPGYNADDFLQAMHLAIGAYNNKKSHVKKAEGDNLLKVGPADTAKKMVKIAKESAPFNRFVSGKGLNIPIANLLAGTSPDDDGDEVDKLREAALVAHFTATITDLQSFGAYALAPTRLGMPQADDEGVGGEKVLKALSQGDVYAPAVGSTAKSRNETVQHKGDLILERWQKLAGLLKD